MWIEEKIEGSRNQRIQLDKQKFGMRKGTKKLFKHLAWILVAFATGITFIGYFSPIRQLVPDFLTLNHLNPYEIFWVSFFSLATYLNAGWLREQVCIHMCPYARFQAVMYDNDTYAVTYDTKRGEPRSSRKKNEVYTPDEKGACIDCQLCVQVCPVGIDIRDGLQYQCIACALCIDACDSIMDQMNYERGLIRYATEHEIQGEKTHIIRPRSVAYSFMLVVMLIILGYYLSSRVPFELDVARDRGSLYQITPNDNVQNYYTLNLINMSQETEEYSIQITGLNTPITDIPKKIALHESEKLELPISIEVSPRSLTKNKTPIVFVITRLSDNKVIAEEESRFIAPLQ
jgi:cytochrome c oxidase accessory protein FixG